MMKLGCMSLSYQREFTAGTLDLERFIDRAHQLRLDGIDLHTHAFASQDPAYLRSIRMRALKKGIALSYIGVSSNFGVPAGEKLDEQVATAKHWIDVAQFMGIPLVRVFAAWMKIRLISSFLWTAAIRAGVFSATTEHQLIFP